MAATGADLNGDLKPFVAYAEKMTTLWSSPLEIFRIWLSNTYKEDCRGSVVKFVHQNSRYTVLFSGPITQPVREMSRFQEALLSCYGQEGDIISTTDLRNLRVQWREVRVLLSLRALAFFSAKIRQPHGRSHIERWEWHCIVSSLSCISVQKDICELMFGSMLEAEGILDCFSIMEVLYEEALSYHTLHSPSFQGLPPRGGAMNTLISIGEGIDYSADNDLRAQMFLMAIESFAKGRENEFQIQYRPDDQENNPDFFLGPTCQQRPRRIHWHLMKILEREEMARIQLFVLHDGETLEVPPYIL